MSKRNSESERYEKYRRVLETLRRYESIDKAEVAAVCQEKTTRFITLVLNDLIAQQVVIPTREKIDGRTVERYRWRVDRNEFDHEQWLRRTLETSQVRNAPQEERPRERLLRFGAQALTVSELLAILIRSGRRGESALQAGQKVAKEFEDSLHRLPHQSPSDLKAVSSVVSEVAYCQIMAGVELGRRVESAISNREPDVPINSPDAAICYCQEKFRRLAYDAQQEEFHIVTLNTKLHPIRTHRITVGTLDASLVHPREVFRPAIRDAAASVLLVHNHPSGDPTPSQEDRNVTRRLREAGELLGIRVIDHIIVARHRAVSLEQST